MGVIQSAVADSSHSGAKLRFVYTRELARALCDINVSSAPVYRALFNTYSPKWRCIAVDIHQAASAR